MIYTDVRKYSALETLGKTGGTAPNGTHFVSGTALAAGVCITAL